MSDIKEIGHIDISDAKRIVLSTSNFRGSERIDLREHYINKEGGYNPSRRGVNCNSEWLEALVNLINKLNDI